ncbi:MAG: O-antigen ligase family protein [Clostridia bacterium]|nr:O-antigen ligase family protein [Clostridia bacterium]
MEKIKNKLVSAAPRALFWLFVIQPVLDVASYWANKLSLTSVTTALRFLMFAAVVIFSFAVSKKKKRCLALYATIAVFFALHALACFIQGGYIFFSDAANFLRIAQFPVFTICFIDVFAASPEARKKIPKAFFFILIVIICVVALSFVAGMPEFTYSETFDDGSKDYYGFRGWFEVANAQSSIVVLLVPLTLFFAYEKKNEIVFTIVAGYALANLYFYGTRFTYYSIFIICAGFAITLAINRQKRIAVYVVLVLAAAAAFVGLKSSFMYLHQNNYRSIMSERQESTENELERISNKYNVEIDPTIIFGEDVPDETIPLTTGETVPDERLREAANEVRTLYTDLYERYCGDMVEKFGINRVARIYNTTNDPFVLSDMRLKKINFARLSWEDSGLMCKLFGFQYATLVTDKTVYDLENDFAGTFYFVGWLGIIPYILFIVYYPVRAAVCFIRNRKKSSIELLAALMTLVLIILAAQFSGNVLRRPNVSIYLSVILACIHSMTGRIFAAPGRAEEKPDEAEHNNPGL